MPTNAQLLNRIADTKPWSLEGKVALVTGGGRGIGREMCVELARHGCAVAINYANSVGPAEQLARELRERYGVRAAAIRADVTDVTQIASLFRRTKTEFGKIDIAVSNAGIVSFGHIADVTEDEYDTVMRTNTRGQFFVAREAYRNLEVGGRIILMGSITGQAKAVPRHAVYSGSKGAIETFVRALAVDCGDKKITVNCVAPGGIKTDMYEKVCREYIPGGDKLSDREVDEYAMTWSPLSRVGMPFDIARVVAFLASEAGEWVNGKVIGIDGGACM